MTREDAIEHGKEQLEIFGGEHKEFIELAIKALEQEPLSFKWCTDCKEYDQEKHCCHRWSKVIRDTVEEMKQEQEPKTGHCKDCKWWKDSDGAFRRGIGAESQCPMNRIEVFDGSGYCYLFEPQESEGI